MLDWIKSVLTPTPGAADASSLSGHVDPDLLRMLRQELQECEALYRTSAYQCGQMCPERIGHDYQKFAWLMLDLHHGLLIKMFIEIAQCDRQWNDAEREVAMVVLRHVWGVDVTGENLVQSLEHVAAHAEMLKWDELLKPFVELPPLAVPLGELGVKATRIANLIAKADGQVTNSEAQKLKLIQSQMENALATRNLGPESLDGWLDLVGLDKGVGKLVNQKFAVADEQPGEKSKKDKPSTAIEHAGPQSAEERFRMYEAAMQELDTLVGLDLIKDDIRELVSFLKIQQARERHDLPTTQVTLHTIFQGNPGTGKTTVARILAHIFCGLGFLDKGHTIETDRSGLVAEYAGQTGPKTHERVDESLGGILFVDEAYSLVAESGDDPFGTEAMQALLKRMEDERQRLVVVLAGYPQPMQRLLRSNPGLSSRFQRTLDFPDYTARELLKIFYSMCKKNHYTLPKATQRKLQTGFQYLLDHKDEHFGNARLARNVFELAIRRMASRIITVAPLTRELLTTLQPDDIHMEGVPFKASAQASESETK